MGNAPTIPPSSGPIPPSPPSGGSSSHAEGGQVKGHQIHTASGSQFSDELVSDLFINLKSSVSKAEQVIKDYKFCDVNPKQASRELAKLVGGARQALEERHKKKSPAIAKRLFGTIEKINRGCVGDEKEKKNPFHNLRAAKLIKKVAEGKGNIFDFIQELATMVMPKSHEYVLESAWLSLFGEQRHVILAGTTFTSRSFKALLRALKQSENLVSLSLSACKILHKGKERIMGDREAEVISQNLFSHPTLKKLQFSYQSIGDKGAISLGKLFQSLHYLNITANQITDSAITIFSSYLSHHDATLLELTLEMNKVSDEGATALSAALHTNNSLHILSLWGNELSYFGAKAFIDTLDRKNTILRRLNLGENLLSNEEKDKIFVLGDYRLVI